MRTKSSAHCYNSTVFSPVMFYEIIQVIRIREWPKPNIIGWFRSFLVISFGNLVIPLRRQKRLIFLGQGPVQGLREELQGPCARAMKKVQGVWGFSKDVALAHFRGPSTSSCGGTCTYPSGPFTQFYLQDLWPLHMALAPLFVALAQALAPVKWAFSVV